MTITSCIATKGCQYEASFRSEVENGSTIKAYPPLFDSWDEAARFIGDAIVAIGECYRAGRTTEQTTLFIESTVPLFYSHMPQAEDEEA